MAAMENAVTYLKNQGVNIGFVKGGKARLWSTSPSCDFVVTLPGTRFDVGFEKQADGAYYPIFDAHGGIVRKLIGAPNTIYGETVEEEQALNISKLLDLYGVYAAKSQLESEGYGYYSEVTYDEADDSFCLEISKAY